MFHNNFAHDSENYGFGKLYYDSTNHNLWFWFPFNLSCGHCNHRQKKRQDLVFSWFWFLVTLFLLTFHSIYRFCKLISETFSLSLLYYNWFQPTISLPLWRHKQTSENQKIKSIYNIRLRYRECKIFNNCRIQNMSSRIWSSTLAFVNNNQLVGRWVSGRWSAGGNFSGTWKQVCSQITSTY